MGSFEVQRNVQYICLELLLSFVNDMAARANEVGIEHYPPNVHLSSFVALA
jgi:brefeldin A-resistance guanine nucleotide exchange factor 1